LEDNDEDGEDDLEEALAEFEVHRLTCGFSHCLFVYYLLLFELLYLFLQFTCVVFSFLINLFIFYSLCYLQAEDAAEDDQEEELLVEAFQVRVFYGV